MGRKFQNSEFGISTFSNVTMKDDKAASQASLHILNNQSTSTFLMHMDILIRFWDENEKLVSTIYMLSLFCNCLATLNVAEMFLDIRNDDYKKKYSIKWEL